MAERELDRAVPELSPREYEIFLADHAINQRGVRVDLPLVDRMRALSKPRKPASTPSYARIPMARSRPALR